MYKMKMAQSFSQQWHADLCPLKLRCDHQIIKTNKNDGK